MLATLTTSSPWLTLQHYQNPPYISPGSQSSGMVRYNPNMSRLEVYDGNTWLELGGSATVNLAGSAQEILEWARKKMQEEVEYNKLAETNPAVQDALIKMRQAESQLRVVTALVKEDNVAG